MGFDALAPLESVSALGAFRLAGVDFFATGRAGDRLAAARRCFGMQCWPGSFGQDSNKRPRTGQATLLSDEQSHN